MAEPTARGTDPRLVEPDRGIPPQGAENTPPFDPLRLCIFATVALLGWLTGPLAVLVFAGVGFAGYWKARRAGLTQSKCYLRDTRLVLAYLALVALAATAAIVAWVLQRLWP